MATVEIKFKDLREAVAALNETNLIAEKIKLVGSPKEVILQQFMDAMVKIPDDAEGKFPGPKVCLDFYNSILDAEEKAAKESETKPEAETPSTETPIEAKENKPVKPPKEKKEKVVKEETKVAKFTRTDAFIATIKESNNSIKTEEWNKKANSLYAEKGGKDNLEQSKWEMQYLIKILVGFGYAEIKEGIISLK